MAAFEPPPDLSTVPRVAVPIVVQKSPETAPNTANDTAAAATPNGTATGASPAGPPKDGTATGAPPVGTPKDATAANDTNDESKDVFAPLAAAWAKKEAAAKAAGTDKITTALIGSPLQSREEAENEMKVMRKCGLEN